MLLRDVPQPLIDGVLPMLALLRKMLARDLYAMIGFR
jgi:hypothetical protein